ncbi:hypothetical protein X728_02920 [Mesorhizobium sp. L103C120A0]|nr:hypothetical protein X728_02920 [Mesorhizobium sp. L103C120A0]
MLPADNFERMRFIEFKRKLANYVAKATTLLCIFDHSGVSRSVFNNFAVRTILRLFFWIERNIGRT